MFTIKTLNAISPVGLAKLNKNLFDVSVDTDSPDGILVRSADLLNTTFNDNLLAIARAGAGVNNIPLDRCSEQGIVVFNTPGANANAVAELVIGMLIAGSRNVAAAAQSGSVTYQNQQAEDITTRYMDTEARLASLTAQRTRLQELQAQADTLADLLEIESSLSDVQYQIESWQSQLDWYSNQVSCCTVYITLNEVETLTPTSTSFGAKLLAALRNGWTGFVSGAQAVAVFLVGAWPAILIGAVCGVIYYRVRHPRKKK